MEFTRLLGICFTITLPIALSFYISYKRKKKYDDYLSKNNKDEDK